MSNTHLPPALQDMIAKAMATIASKDPAWLAACETIKWEINPNLRRVLGQAWYGYNKIEISGPFYNEGRGLAVYDTVTHELAHFIAYKVYKCKGHGMMWKYVHKNLGGDAKRCATVEKTGYVPKRNTVTRVILERGGKEYKITFGRWSRQKYYIENAGYKYLRTIKIDGDKETILHSAKEVAKAACTSVFLDANLNVIGRMVDGKMTP